MEIEKIREIIRGAGSVALTIGEDPKEEEVLLREVFRIFFQNKGVLVYLFPESPGEIKNKWSSILDNYKNPSLSSEISIRLHKNIFNVKEIGYEDDDEFLTLKISADGDNAKKNDILLDVKPVTFDVLICIGSSDITFNNFKEKIFLTAEDKILSEKIFEITELGETETTIRENNFSNLLLAALLLETKNFKEKVTEGSLNLAHRLLSLGANKKLVDEIMNKDFSLSFAQILGRTLSRTRSNQSLQSNWTFISSRDFEKADIKNIGVFLIRRIAEEVKEIVPKQPIFVILWENGENMIQALITTEKDKERQAGPYKNFSEAEIKIRQILKEVL